MKKTRVLIVDDSSFIRNMLAQGLAQDPEIEIVATAEDPFEARDKIVEFKPDVMTLDVVMPKMNGLEFLQKLMPQHPIPVIMVSSYTSTFSKITFDALVAGAIDFVLKPSSLSGNGLPELLVELRNKVKAAAQVDISRHRLSHTTMKSRGENKDKSIVDHSKRVIAIGASTGGTNALKELLPSLSVNSPGIVVSQHMPSGFTKTFADRLNEITKMKVKEAETGDLIEPGKVLIAPGDFHLEVQKQGNKFKVICYKGPKMNGHRPSVDVLFKSVAKVVGSEAIGILLTGMGEDGANGLKEMRLSGSRTLAQDKNSSIIFGMPKKAWDIGAAEQLVSLQNMHIKINKILKEMG